MAATTLHHPGADAPLVTWRDDAGRAWAAPADLLGTVGEPDPAPTTDRPLPVPAPPAAPLPMVRRRARPATARLLGGTFVLAALLGAYVFLPGLLAPAPAQSVAAARVPPALTATPVPPPARAVAALPTPQAPPPPAALPPGLVRPGDTTRTLAARLNVPVAALPDTMYTGEIVTPVVPPAPVEASLPPAQASGPTAPAQEGVSCGACLGGVPYTGPHPAPDVMPYTGETRAPFVPGYAPPTLEPFIGPLRPGQCQDGRCGP